ncbi:MAG: glycosyltransferase [Gammaproteobacteria bacterium]|nr:glycosyltransferase [Gammaproteobacteria bacterium]
MIPGSSALIVFARAPRPGSTKTRLIPTVGAARAAAIYEALLAHALSCAEALPGIARYLFVDHETSMEYFSTRLNAERWRFATQVTGDLGARMAAALNLVLAAHPQAVLVGSDIVDLTSADLQLGLTRLRDGDEVVLGPSADGGYWLIGLSAARPDLFTALPWGSDTVYQETVQRMEAGKLRWSRLPLRHDIDTPQDLARFANQLGG